MSLMVFIFTDIAIPVFPKECTIAVTFRLQPLPFVNVTISIVIITSTMELSVFEFPNIFVTIVKNKPSFAIFTITGCASFLGVTMDYCVEKKQYETSYFHLVYATNNYHSIVKLINHHYLWAQPVIFLQYRCPVSYLPFRHDLHYSI